MEPLVVKSEITFSEVEQAFKEVLNRGEIPLRLPNALKARGGLGIEGLVSQLIATWLRSDSSSHNLETYCDADDSDSFKQLGSTFYGMVALRQASQILTSDLKTVPAEFALQTSYEHVKNILKGNYRDAFDDSYIAIPSIKGSGINREYNCPFYLGEKVVGKNQFKSIVQSVLDKVISETTSREMITKYEDHISEIVRELFENTHKHGRSDHANRLLPTNFRAAIFNSTVLTKERLYELTHSKVEGFFNFMVECEMWMTKHGKDMPVLDVTVVDAGPGYARKWTGKSKEQLSLEEEIDAVYYCFQKNKSSGENTADGFGLTHILKDLSTVRGWFRLRTGSVAVSRSFFFGDGSAQIERKNITRCGEFIEGTSFNIVIPLVNAADGAM